MVTGFQLVKKFPAFYGTRKFITAFKLPRKVVVHDRGLLRERIITRYVFTVRSF